MDKKQRLHLKSLLFCEVIRAPPVRVSRQSREFAHSAPDKRACRSPNGECKPKRVCKEKDKYFAKLTRAGFSREARRQKREH